MKFQCYFKKNSGDCKEYLYVFYALAVFELLKKCNFMNRYKVFITVFNRVKCLLAITLI